MGVSVQLRPDSTTYPDVRMVVFVDDQGHVTLLGYNLDEDYEWGVSVDRSHKDLLLLCLIRNGFHSDVTFCAWLEEVGIPYRVIDLPKEG